MNNYCGPISVANLWVRLEKWKVSAVKTTEDDPLLVEMYVECVTSSFSYKLAHFPPLTGSEIDLRHVANLRAFLSDLKILVQTLIRSRFPVLSWPIYIINAVDKKKSF